MAARTRPLPSAGRGYAVGVRFWLLVAMVCMAACAPSTAPQSAPADAAASDAGGQSPAAGRGAPKALDFTATLIDGGQISGSDLAGRDVILWYWAPW